MTALRPRGAPEVQREALVLSGGGAKGAYEVGVIKALFEGKGPLTSGRPFAAEVFTGASVGAYNAALLAQEEKPDLAAALRLEELWRRRIANTLASCGNGVYHLRFDPLEAVEPGCLFRPVELAANFARDFAAAGAYAFAYGAQLLTSTEPLSLRALQSFNLAALFSRQPLEALVAETLDLSRLAASPNALSVTVSDWQNGEGLIFRKDDIVGRVGIDAILASTALPGLFAPVPIDGTIGVDGSLLMNTPIKPALEEGATVLHVILVDPAVSDIPFPALPNTVDAMYRIYAILAAAQVNKDIRHAAIINEELAALSGLGSALGQDLPAVRVRRALTPRGKAKPVSSNLGKTYRPITIHVYRPQEDLAGAVSFLDFSEAAIDRLIRLGYEDVLEHDCYESQCVLPPLAESPPRKRKLAP